MRIVNVREAKTQLSKLIEAAAHGERIVIAKAGKPVAILVPVFACKTVRKPGAMAGMVRIAAEFDSPLPDDLQSAFESQ